MPRRPTNKAVVRIADGDRLDDARRKLLADWCRLVGQRVGGSEKATETPGNQALANAGSGKSIASIPADGPPAASVAALGLPPRMAQILTALLSGASEKQIARNLSISPHTVHTYVKQLHKRLDVSSRGELLAKFVHVGS